MSIENPFLPADSERGEAITHLYLFSQVAGLAKDY